MKSLRIALCSSLLLSFVAACGSGGGSSATPPSGLTYSENPASYTQGFAITPNVPTISGPVTTYSIAPALPTGLSLDGTSGAISGTPLVESAASDFTVTATNSGGSTNAVVNITVNPPQPRSLYVANFTDSTIGSFHVGSLRHSGYGLSDGTNPRALAVRQDGAFLYAANDGSNNVTTFSLDPVSGRVTLSGAAVSAGSQPAALVTEPTGQYLYCANRGGNTISVFTIDTGTPVAASTTNTGTDPVALAVDPTGAFLYSANTASDDIEHFTIDAGTGAITSASVAASTGSPNALTIATTPAGSFLYVVNSSADTVGQFSIDPATGALTPLAPATVSTGTGTNPRDVQASPDGTFLYVSYQDTDEIGLFEIDQVTGALTPHPTTPTFSTGAGPGALAMGPAGQKLFVATQLDIEVSELAIAGDGSLTHVQSVRTRSTPTDLLLGPAEEAFSVTSDHAYISNATGNSVNQYAATPASADLSALTPSSLPASGTGPRGVALSPDGELVLVSAETGTAISLFTRNASNGQLTSAGTEAANNAADIAFEPTGRFAYTTLRLVGLQPYSVDTASPDLAPLTQVVIGTDPRGLGIDPTGQFLYLSDTVSGIFQLRINATNGELTSLGSVAADGGTREIAVHPSGRWAYATNTGGDSISMYSINAVTGGLTALTPPTLFVGTGTDPEGVVLSPYGEDLYVALQGSEQVAHYSVDVDTGLLTFVDARPTFSQTPRALGIDASGRMIAVANSGSNGVVSLYERDTVTGAISDSGFAASDDGPSAVVFSFDIQ